MTHTTEPSRPATLSESLRHKLDMRTVLAGYNVGQSRGYARCQRQPSPHLVLTVFLAVSVASSQTFTSLVSFNGLDGANPYGALVQGTDGYLYGTTSSYYDYYASGYGGIYKISPPGVITTLHTFCSLSNCEDGELPYAGLTLATDGNFYGTTSRGGANGNGTIFRITPAGEFTVLFSFCGTPNCAGGAVPYAGLVQAADGNLYGTTPYGGAYGGGTIFQITPQGKLTTLYNFCSRTNCPDGYEPFGALLLADNGDLFGTTYGGGTAERGGTVFEITPQGKLTTLYSFCVKGNCSEGSFPEAGLVQGANRSFYGTTSSGGAYRGCYPEGCGTIYEVTPTGTHTRLYTFCSKPNCEDGSNPSSSLVQGNDGNFYGVTGYTSNGTNYGHIFTITPAGKLTVLHSFSGADGQSPQANLVQATNGILYGTTELGGIYNDGTVFSLSLGLKPFVTFALPMGKISGTAQILGQGLTGTTSVTFNGVPAMNFVVKSDTYLTAIVPSGATTGAVVVTTPSGTLTSDKSFVVTQ